MKRFYFLLFCILFVGLIAKPCFSEEGRKPPLNGYEWESWSEITKTSWLIGFDEGHTQTSVEAYIFLRRFADAVSLKFAGTVEELYEVADKMNNEFLDRTVLGRGTFGQIAAGLDDFYKDYRNKSILINEALYIVKLEFTGAPQEFIEQGTKLLRMPWEERIKEQASLLAGNQEYKEAWEKWGKYLPAGVIPTPFK